MVKFFDGIGEELSLWVRHMAWLEASPDDKSPSRADQIRKDGNELSMPGVSAAHVLDHLQEIGPAIAGHVITHAEIAAWQSNTGIELSAWEARMLRRLSVEYLVTLNKKDCPPPWADAPYLKPAKNTVAANLQSSIMELVNL